LLGFLKKKIPTPPKFSHIYKKNSKPLPPKIPGYTLATHKLNNVARSVKKHPNPTRHSDALLLSFFNLLI